MNLLKSKIPVFEITFFIIFTFGINNVVAQSNLDYCNAVQNNVGLIRYPVGTIAATSNNTGEIADAMTMVPRVYPCVNKVVNRGGEDDWRASIAGDPSRLIVEYLADKPSGASSAEITVTPHMSVFKIRFPEKEKNKYVVFDFSRHKMDVWAKLYKWTERSVKLIDDKTIQATVSEPGKKGVYFTIKFSQPCMGYGIIDSVGTVKEEMNQVSGLMLGMYAQFDTSTVTVSISESFTSMEQAVDFLKTEPFGFDSAHQQCKMAWEKTIDIVRLEGTENSKRMAYTALYSMLVNVINGSQGSAYLKYYPRPLSIASSAYWQFIGGYQSCAWDNFRTAYPFLMLSYPEVMKDVVNTYLARYQRDGFVEGNICLFTGPTANHRNIRLIPVIISQALQSGIKADYTGIYKALKSNFNDDKFFPSTISSLGYVTQPNSGGKACSETLEWSTGLHSLSMLAKANGDDEEMNRDYRLSLSYKNLWDRKNLLFRVKNADGSWGIINNKSWHWDPNPQGLFEGTNKDWMFAVPHDPYGLINLPGQKRFVSRVIDYCMNDSWFNDYQYHYPYLLYYANAANEAQKIIRNTWIPMFNEGIMYEGVSPKPPYNGWKSHYTSNAGWLICCMTGLYPVQSPAGQYIITSPTLIKTVIKNGEKNITIKTLNNNDENIFIKEIKINGKIYPSYLIPAEKLVSGVTIDLLMSNDPESRLGELYISSSDGFVRSSELVSNSHLKCRIEVAINNATTKIYCSSKPVRVTMNDKIIEAWDFDKRNNILTIQSKDITSIEVFLK
ncbi:MAG: glycoside hydrolase family 92 protein [Mariniphaga sp.]|nr:glycoside hydrolase family 92 protein [Mariniphaga sp.]